MKSPPMYFGRMKFHFNQTWRFAFASCALSAEGICVGGIVGPAIFVEERPFRAAFGCLTTMGAPKRKPGWFARLFLRRVGCGYIPHGATGRMLVGPALNFGAPDLIQTAILLPSMDFARSAWSLTVNEMIIKRLLKEFRVENTSRTRAIRF